MNVNDSCKRFAMHLYSVYDEDDSYAVSSYAVMPRPAKKRPPRPAVKRDFWREQDRRRREKQREKEKAKQAEWEKRVRREKEKVEEWGEWAAMYH